MTLAQRAVARIREEMSERKISQRDLAKELKCSQGRVAKLLNGGVHLRINDVGRMAEAVGLEPAEVVRDRGLTFYANMTPTEVAIVDRLRRRPQALQGLLLMLDIKADETRTRVQVPKTPKRGRPLASDRSRKD